MDSLPEKATGEETPLVAESGRMDISCVIKELEWLIDDIERVLPLGRAQSSPPMLTVSADDD